MSSKIALFRGLSIFVIITIGLNTLEGVPLKVNFNKERSHFESLIAAGRTLSCPLSTGFVLGIVTNDKSNWNVSHRGLEKAIGLLPEQLLQSYSQLVEDLQNDENVTVSNKVYYLRTGWMENNVMKLLKGEVQHVSSETSNQTLELINTHLMESTRELLVGKVVPVDGVWGTPFPFSSEAIILSSFYYNNNWAVPFEPLEKGQTFNNFENVSFIRAKGEFLVAEGEEYTAISIPFQGESKSLVLVLPHVNVTKHLKKKVLVSKRGFGENEYEEDVIPFPKSWNKKPISFSIPTFNLTSADQFGKDLEELGLNETFCTTLHDRRGKFPYYVRPIVQKNAVVLSTDGIEIASATGTAVQKFYLGLDLGGNGYPKLDYKSPSSRNRNIIELDTTNTLPTSLDSTTPYPTNIYESPTDESHVEELMDKGPSIVFDRSFIWYLNDAEVGPLFYGVVEKIEQPQEEEAEDETGFSQALKDAENFILWSCKSFKQSGDINEYRIGAHLKESI